MSKNKRHQIGNQRPSNNTVVLYDTSFATWLVIIFIFVVGLLLFMAPWTWVTSFAKFTLEPKLILSAMGMGAVLVALLMMNESLNQIILDRIKNKIFFNKRLFRTISRVLDCHEIADTIIDTTKDSEGDNAYRVSLQLKSGETVLLSKAYLSLRSSAEYERDRVDHILKHPYDKFRKKDNTPFISIGGSKE